MKDFPVFTLKVGSKIRVYLRSGNESKILDGEFKGLSDTFQPLLYVADSDKNYLINLLDIIYIETTDKLEEIEKEKRADYVS
ncbi:MAG: hypothetical protein QXU18_02140 [Thermoplasmatales archaeon]